jgi:hypothetical protein
VSCLRCHIEDNRQDFLHEYVTEPHPKKLGEQRFRWNAEQQAIVPEQAVYSRCVHCRGWLWANESTVCESRVVAFLTSPEWLGASANSGGPGAS